MRVQVKIKYGIEQKLEILKEKKDWEYGKMEINS